MAKLAELRARMATLGRHLAEARSHVGANPTDNADIAEMADRHAALDARLAKATDADTHVEGEVEALLDSFGRWAAAQDRKFGRP
jgi:hypothetical protein